MPLSCDCYGGCWAAHSESWPRFVGSMKIVVETPHHQASMEAFAYYRMAQKVLPRGTYVFMVDHLRVETQELLERLEQAIEWGLLDTVDKLWIGNDAGPLRFKQKDLAQIAAQVADVQLGNPPGRIRVVPYLEGPLVLRDTLPTKMEPVAALKGLEEGRYL